MFVEEYCQFIIHTYHFCPPEKTRICSRPTILEHMDFSNQGALFCSVYFFLSAPLSIDAEVSMLSGFIVSPGRALQPPQFSFPHVILPLQYSLSKVFLGPVDSAAAHRRDVRTRWNELQHGGGGRLRSTERICQTIWLRQ